MKTLTFALLILLSNAAFSQEQKYYRVVEYFKTEDRFIYFNWTTDSATTAYIANTRTDKGAVYTMETKTMTPKKAKRENERNEKRKERANYPHIKDPN